MFKTATPDLTAADGITLIRDAVQASQPLNDCEERGAALALAALLSADERPAADLITEWGLNDDERMRADAARYLHVESVYRIKAGFRGRIHIWYVEAGDAADASATATKRAGSLARIDYLEIRHALASDVDEYLESEDL